MKWLLLTLFNVLGSGRFAISNFTLRYEILWVNILSVLLLPINHGEIISIDHSIIFIKY